MKPSTNMDITTQNAKHTLGDSSFIDDDLVLFDSFDMVPLSTEPRRVGCLFVAMCLEGSAQYTVDTKEYMVHKNDVIIVNEGQVIGNYMFSPDCKGVAIMSSIDFFAEIIKEVHEISQLFLLAYSRPVFNLKQEKAEVFMSYFNNIRLRVDDKEHHFRKQLTMSLLKAMIYDIGNEIYQLQLSTDTKQTRGEKIFSDFILLLRNHFRHERRVNWYAQQLFITPKYLSESVKLVSKRTPNDWIDRYVIMEIRVLLRNSTLSIKEIAQELHFPNQSFLGKYFKEHVGVSPSKYRKGG